MTPGAPLRILLSEAAAGRMAGAIREVLGSRELALLAPGHAEARLADAAFVSRDVTGLSTKHEVLPATQLFHDTLRGARNLRWVHCHSAGADRPIYQELLARGVAVTTSSGANAPVVAQNALLGLLALARHWPRLIAAQREHRWAHLLATGLPRDLQGQTAVIVGWGPIAQEIGRLLQAVGLRLIVARQRDTPAGEGIETITSANLRAVLPRADWLLLACPATPDTHRLIGAAELALLAPHCGLINVARGEVVDEPALIETLRAGRIAGAYLDVFAHEPLPAASPLWDLPNAIVTPHSAGLSDGNEARVAGMFLDNLARWTRGEALRNPA